MTEQHHQGPQYLMAGEQEIAALAHKLLEFSQTLNPVEQALFMERIKRSMPSVEFTETVILEPSLPVFGGWLNSVVPGSVRWFPAQKEL